MHNLLRLIGRFHQNRRGNVAIIFALATIPLVSAIGCAIDYSLATRMQAKLQSAADGASVASISQKSLGYIAATQMTGDGTITAGVTDANNVFDGNMSTIGGYKNLQRTSTVTKAGIKLTSNVVFQADVPVTFMKVIGFQTLTVKGSSTSTASLPPYLDFYLTLDVSGSMGLPSTPAEAQRFQYYNPDDNVDYPTGCTLACHFPHQTGACVNPTSPPQTNASQSGYPTNNNCLGYAISRVSPSGFQKLLVLQSPQKKYPYQNLDPSSSNYLKYQELPSSMLSTLPNSLYAALPPVSSCPTAGTDNCIQLRLDAVGFALNATQAANGVSGLFETANNKEIITNQFRIGIYPFIRLLDSNFSPLTTAINGSSSTPGTINYAAANLATLLDTNQDANLGSGGTHIDTALNSINTLITTVGDGSASNDTPPYVFLVTDGAQDNQYKGVPNGGWSGSNHATVIDPVNTNVCSQLKNRGIIVSVLNIPYQPIIPPNTTFAGGEDVYANNNIPSIEPSLQACASPPDAGGSYYYKATSPTEIQNSLKAMFNHSLITAHITN
jgi:Flp pilus assembly protein TadG